MRVIILGYTGAAGKTTIAGHVFKPNNPNAKVIAVESINESTADLGIETKQIPGERFRDIYSDILKAEEMILDVGASNIADFLEGLAQYEGSQHEFDYYVIPVTRGTKEQKEAMSMLLTLQKYEIPTNKIKVVFNRVKSDLYEEFSLLLKFFKKYPEFSFNTNCAIMENALFDILAMQKISIGELLNDTTDYRTLIREEGDETLQQDYIDRFTAISLAKTVKRNLDEVYTAILEAPGVV